MTVHVSRRIPIQTGHCGGGWGWERETRDERRETRDETMAHLLRLNQLTTECNQIGKDADEIVATLFEVANLCKELEDEGKI